MSEKFNTTIVTLPDNNLLLKWGKFEDEINVDDLCKIDYANLFAESITAPALLNRIGLLKAAAEEVVKYKKLEFEIYEANLRKDTRRTSTENSGKIDFGEGEWVKLTEKALDEFILLDEGYQVKRKNHIKAEKDLNTIDAIFWAVKDKSSKLNILVQKFVSEDFEKDIIYGKVNGFMVSRIDKIKKGN